MVLGALLLGERGRRDNGHERLAGNAARSIARAPPPSGSSSSSSATSRRGASAWQASSSFKTHHRQPASLKLRLLDSTRTLRQLPASPRVGVSAREERSPPQGSLCKNLIRFCFLFLLAFFRDFVVLLEALQARLGCRAAALGYGLVVHSGIRRAL